MTLWAVLQGGELYFTLAFMLYYPGALIILGLLIRCSYRMQLGFRRTLLNLLLLWCLPFCILFGIMVSMDGNRPDVISGPDIGDVLLAMAYMATCAVPVAILTAYITGAVTLWKKRRHQKAVVKACEKRLESRQPFI